MTPATFNKSEMLQLWATDRNPHVVIGQWTAILAALTSQDKAERERAKNMVRDMVRQGQKIQADQRAALVLIERGERCDERP